MGALLVTLLRYLSRKVRLAWIVFFNRVCTCGVCSGCAGFENLL